MHIRKSSKRKSINTILLCALIITPIISKGNTCDIEAPEDNIEFDYSEFKQQQQKRYFGLDENQQTGQSDINDLIDNPENILKSSRNKFKQKAPGEVPEHIKTALPETAEAITEKSSIPTLVENEEFEPLLASSLEMDTELLGPIGGGVAVAFWIKGIGDTFEQESATAYDKATAILSIVPILGQIMQGMEVAIDHKILHDRATHIHHSNQPFDTSKKYINDYNVERLHWVKFADNYYNKYLPTMAKQIIEEVVLDTQIKYAAAVRLQDDTLDRIQKETEFELYKSMHSDLIKAGNKQRIKFPSASIRYKNYCPPLSSIDTNSLFSHAKCLRDYHYIPRLNEISQWVTSQNFRQMVATYTTAKSSISITATRNIDAIREALEESIPVEVEKRWGTFLAGRFHKNARDHLLGEYTRNAMYEFADTELNREATGDEIARLGILVEKAYESCGTTGAKCTRHPDRYKPFSEADSRLVSGYRTIMNYNSTGNLSSIIQTQLNNYLPKLLNGDALPPKDNIHSQAIEITSETPYVSWYTSLVNAYYNNYAYIKSSKEKYEKLKTDLRAILMKYSGRLWVPGYIYTKGYPHDLLKFKVFLDSDSDSNLKPFFKREGTLAIAEMRSVLNDRAVDDIYEYYQYVKHPYFGPYPSSFNLETDAPAFYEKITQAINTGTTSNFTLNTAYQYLVEVYNNNTSVKVLEDLGSLHRIGLFNKILNTSNDSKAIDFSNKKIFFSNSLAPRHKAWQSLDTSNYVNDLLSWFESENNMAIYRDLLPVDTEMSDNFTFDYVSSTYKHKQLFSSQFLLDPEFRLIPFVYDILNELATISKSALNAFNMADELNALYPDNFATLNKRCEQLKAEGKWPWSCVVPAIDFPFAKRFFDNNSNCGCDGRILKHKSTGLYRCEQHKSSCGGVSFQSTLGYVPNLNWYQVQREDLSNPYASYSYNDLIDKCNDAPNWYWGCAVPAVPEIAMLKGEQCYCEGRILQHNSSGLFRCEQHPSSCGGVSFQDTLGYPPNLQWYTVKNTP